MVSGRFKVRPVAATVAVTALLAVGCGSDDESGGSSGSGVATNAAGAADLKGEQLSFVSFGGELQDAEEVAFTDPFASKTGAIVKQDGPIDYSKLKVQVDTGNVSWDVVHADTFFVTANCGKLFEPLPASVDRSAVDPDLITNKCGVPVSQVAMLGMYNEAKFGERPPADWADFFDTEKYPGKRGMWTYVNSGQLEAALLADGVAPDDLYPLDLDRAFEKLESIKDDITFYDTLAQSVQQIDSGAVDMSITFSGRGFAAVEEGADYAPIWNQAIRTWDNIAVTKGSSNADAGFALLDFIATPPPQATLTEEVPYAPTTPASKPDIPALEREYLPTNHVEDTVLQDQSWWAENFDVANDRWTAFIGG